MKEELNVAPYIGAWIEIRPSGVHLPPNLVAPYIGAWIEIAGSHHPWRL